MTNFLHKFENADKNFINTLKSLEIITLDFNLKSLVEEIITNDKWLLEISNKSFSHTNGFDKFILFRGKNLRIRLHIYWPEECKNKSNIHDHRWDFSSFIIKGGYKSEIFQIADEGVDKFLYHYYSEASTKEDYQLMFEEKVKIDIIESKEYFENDVNTGKAGEIHRIILHSNNLTVTFFVTSNYENEYARVFTDSDKFIIEKVKSEKLPPAEIIRKLKSIL